MATNRAMIEPINKQIIIEYMIYVKLSMSMSRFSIYLFVLIFNFIQFCERTIIIIQTFKIFLEKKVKLERCGTFVEPICWKVGNQQQCIIASAGIPHLVTLCCEIMVQQKKLIQLHASNFITFLFSDNRRMFPESTNCHTKISVSRKQNIFVYMFI